MLRSLKRGKEIGVAIKDKNLPGIPQYEEFDFLISLQNFATSIGEVFRLERADVILSFSNRLGTGSEFPPFVCLFVNVVGR